MHVVCGLSVGWTADGADPRPPSFWDGIEPFALHLVTAFALAASALLEPISERAYTSPLGSFDSSMRGSIDSPAGRFNPSDLLRLRSVSAANPATPFKETDRYRLLLSRTGGMRQRPGSRGGGLNEITSSIDGVSFVSSPSSSGQTSPSSSFDSAVLPRPAKGALFRAQSLPGYALRRVSSGSQIDLNGDDFP